MNALQKRIWPYLERDAVTRLESYYQGRSFSGRRFEFLAGGGDQDQGGIANRFTADDIVAVSLLGVSIPPVAALDLLEPTDGGEYITGLLRTVPNHVDLWKADRAVVESGSAAEELWRHLDQIVGIGWVTAGKLLARKRPRLIPVFDRVVRDALMPKRSTLWWVSLWDALQDGQIVARLEELRTAAGLDEKVSLLRVLDVSVWMAGPRS